MPALGRLALCGQLADELGLITKKLNGFKDLVSRQDEIKKQLRELAAMLPAAEKASFEGERWTAMLSECSNQRTIVDMGRLFVAVGQLEFLAHCTFPLKAVDELLGAAAKKDLVSVARTGPREVTVVKRAARTAVASAAREVAVGKRARAA